MLKCAGRFCFYRYMAAKIPFIKTYATPHELVQLLKTRGMEITDEEKAQHYLSHIGYYRLSAYTRRDVGRDTYSLPKKNAATPRVARQWVRPRSSAMSIDVALSTRRGVGRDTYSLPQKHGCAPVPCQWTWHY